MAFKEGVVLGTVSLNATGSGTTAIGATSNSGTIAIGNTSSGAVSIDCGTAGITVGTTANAHSTTVGSTNSTSATTVQSGSGALNVTSTNGALTINSGTGALGISTDASATTVSLATGGAEKTVTLGSTNTSSSLALQYGTSDFTMASATGTVMSALDTGEITYPLQPAFLAIVSTTIDNVTGDGTTYTVVFNSEIYDKNSDYNNTTGVFTAPVTGTYLFCTFVGFGDIGASHTASSNNLINTSNRDIRFAMVNPAATRIASGGSANNYIIGGSSFVDMDASDTAQIDVTVSGSTLTIDILGTASGDIRASFSGCLIS